MSEEGGCPSLMMSKPKLLLSALIFSSKINHVIETLKQLSLGKENQISY